MTVRSQFGPVGVNNPTALVRNSTLSPLQRRFETRRLGPPPLPVFSPPPPRARPREGQTYRGQQYGPDWKNKGSEEDPNYVRRRPHGSVGDIKSDKEIKLPNEEELRNQTSGNDTLTAEQAKISTKEYLNQNICWETMVGQEIVKLVTIDLYITIGSILVIDFLRGLWIKYCSSWWCWDIETVFVSFSHFNFTFSRTWKLIWKEYKVLSSNLYVCLIVACLVLARIRGIQGCGECPSHNQQSRLNLVGILFCAHASGNK